jgi:hypothetical protein
MQERTGGRQVYQLTIHGEMSDVIQSEFADFELQVSHGETHLHADLSDSAALYGLIGRIEALGLVLLDLHRSQGSARIDESIGPQNRPHPAGRHRRLVLAQGPHCYPAAIMNVAAQRAHPDGEYRREDSRATVSPEMPPGRAAPEKSKRPTTGPPKLRCTAPCPRPLRNSAVPRLDLIGVRLVDVSSTQVGPVMNRLPGSAGSPARRPRQAQAEEQHDRI